MTKVHVTLNEDARGDEDLKRQLKQQITDLGMDGINEKRFARYGVLSGDIDEAQLSKIRSIDAVAAVESDEQRHTY